MPRMTSNLPLSFPPTRPACVQLVELGQFPPASRAVVAAVHVGRYIDALEELSHRSAYTGQAIDVDTAPTYVCGSTFSDAHLVGDGWGRWGVAWCVHARCGRAARPGRHTSC